MYPTRNHSTDTHQLGVEIVTFDVGEFVCQNLLGLSGFALADQPPGGFREDKHEYDNRETDHAVLCVDHVFPVERVDGGSRLEGYGAKETSGSEPPMGGGDRSGATRNFLQRSSRLACCMRRQGIPEESWVRAR